jgi:3-oxoacyl-[acyl-carrier-protein] synthase-1
MRAAIAKFDELPYRDSRYRPIIGAAVPAVGLDLQAELRLVAMLVLALEDCLAQAPALSWPSVPLLVGLAEPGRPGGAASLAESLLPQVQEKLGVQFHPRLSRVLAKGHTAGFECLRLARQLLQTPDVPGCLVCGVDSYINASSLQWLEQHWRLKREDNSDGVIPGEAAAVVYVQRQPPAKAETRVAVLGLGFGQEKATVFSEEPLLGLGLTAAARAALAEAKLTMQAIDFRLSDVTGEAYAFKEHSLAVCRLTRTWKAEFPHWHCADSIGDSGAAAGLCQLVLAHHAFSKDYAFGDRCTCYTSAVPGERAVAVLERQQE